LIPSDWEVKGLGEIGTFKNGINKGEEDFGFGFPFVNLMDVFGKAKIIKGSSLGLVNSSSIERKAYELKVGDVLFIRSSVKPSGVGLTSVVVDELEETVYSGFLIRFRDSGKLTVGFKTHCFNEQGFRRRLIDSSTVSANTNINQNALQQLIIPIPPTLAEQTAIATALSDADGLITSLEKLIAKKRNIKQGAMQELLRPKEGWVVKRLGEIGKVYGGLSGKSKENFQNGTYPYIPFMNIMSNPVIDPDYLDFVSIGVSENQNIALKGDLFFNGSSETPAEVGMCSLLEDKIPNLYLNSFCFGFRLFKEKSIDGLFLTYFFRSGEGRSLIFSLAQGATRYNLSKHNFLNLEIPIPSSSEEQTRIATILSDMDTNISTLEKKLEKAKQIKQGMMQQLLTGKIRLV